MEPDIRRTRRWSFVGVGAFGIIVSLAADHLGFGYPGFGVIQVSGLLASAALVVIGLAGLDPVDPQTPDVPRTPARFDPPLHHELTAWVRPLIRIPRRMVLPIAIGLVLVVGLGLLGRVTRGEPVPMLDLEIERDLLLSDRLASVASALLGATDRRDPTLATFCPDGCRFDPASLRRHLRVETDGEAGRITVAVRDDDPRAAAAGATAMVEAYVQNVAAAPRRPYGESVICLLSLNGSCEPVQQPIAVVDRTGAGVPTETTNQPQPPDVAAFVLIAAVAVAGTRRLVRTPEPAGR
ncbi:MAG: hypothetical protein HKN74_00445 [Acidimicrobiia bacterium]|nr:hypothetical protein [Acidimicrobiia bacterium]MBT8215722.1 hypothetical protein [Acidimicrobiia bacterium]NNF08739.1 hypothetical protein [Acidimicrobiia bacterium]NNL70227.1 hypothetical protein [Acidimicrobiia bacterium]